MVGDIRDTIVAEMKHSADCAFTFALGTTVGTALAARAREARGRRSVLLKLKHSWGADL